LTLKNNFKVSKIFVYSQQQYALSNDCIWSSYTGSFRLCESKRFFTLKSISQNWKTWQQTRR